MAEQLPSEIRHEVDDLVITCMDHRFHDWYAKRLTKEAVHRSDKLSYPGSSKAVADGTLIPAIQTSDRLHKIRKVWLFDHTDCGGFGSLEAYDYDEDREAKDHFASLDRASKAIHEVLPHLTVVTYVIGLSGEEILPGSDPRLGPSRSRQA